MAPGLATLDLRDAETTSTPSNGASALAEPIDRRLIVHPAADPAFVEQYRRLGAALHQAQRHDGIRSVMIASAVEAEGKTLSATNLALVLSRSFNKRVLLVDGDLRKPAVHELLQIANDVGLSDLLRRPGSRLPAHAVSPTLSVITGGQHEPDPIGLLAGDAAFQFLAETRDDYDWVVVDTPPVMLFPDAGLFAARLDACVMVVRAATTASPVAVQAAAAIGVSRILGVVLNRAEPMDIAGGYGYGQYGYRRRAASRRRAWWRSGAR